MANTTKITKKDYFAMLDEVVAQANPENVDALRDFIAHELELLNKKSNKEGTSKKTAENAPIKEAILEILANCGTAKTVSELQTENPDVLYKNGELSGQKITALLTQLVKEEKVVRTTNKKKAYFSIA